MKFYHNGTQEEANRLFSEIGASAEKTALACADRLPLTEEQRDFLRRCAGNGGYREWWCPDPVGHLGFSARGTRGTGNYGFIVLVPQSREARRIWRAIDRQAWVHAWRKMGIGLSDDALARLYHLCYGHVPTMVYVADLVPVISACPDISDRALRQAGYRPRHPHEGRAIAAVRAVVRATVR